MMKHRTLEIRPGLFARADGTLHVAPARTLIATDLHLGYEQIIGGALPLWSLRETIERIERALEETGARELVLLGDIVHAPRMSRLCAAQITAGLARLAERVEVIAIAGNHEGRDGARDVLGATYRYVDRAGRRLVHGDDPSLCAFADGRRMPAIVGHFHPSVHLGAGRTVPAFFVSDECIVLPAQTPFSPGLDICGREAHAAVGEWCEGVARSEVYVADGDFVRAFGTVEILRAAQGKSYP